MFTITKEESFRQVISVNLALLKLSGIVRLDDKTLLKMVPSYCLPILAGGVFVAYTYIYVSEFVKNVAHIETAMESFALIISFSGGFLRFLSLYWSRKTVQKMLETVEDLWKILKSQERDHVTLYIKGAKKLTYFFLIQCVITLIFYTISPLFSSSGDGNLNVTRVLPYSFVTEVHQSPYYEILYVIQVFSVLYICMVAVGVDMFGPLLITTVCGHLKVVQEQLRSLNAIEKTNERFIEVPEDDHEAVQEFGLETKRSHHVQLLYSELGSCVNYHRTILCICADIDRLTNFIFLTQLVGSTYILSAIGFKLTGNDQDKYKYFTQILIGIVQLLICNWPPDALSTESQKVANAAYAIPWYHWPSGIKKSICFVILRAQKPVQLTAGKFMNLSLETFATMVSSAVSFFTVLRSFN